MSRLDFIIPNSISNFKVGDYFHYWQDFTYGEGFNRYDVCKVLEIDQDKVFFKTGRYVEHYSYSWDGSYDDDPDGPYFDGQMLWLSIDDFLDSCSKIHKNDL